MPFPSDVDARFPTHLAQALDGAWYVVTAAYTAYTDAHTPYVLTAGGGIASRYAHPIGEALAALTLCPIDGVIMPGHDPIERAGVLLHTRMVASGSDRVVIDDGAGLRWDGLHTVDPHTLRYVGVCTPDDGAYPDLATSAWCRRCHALGAASDYSDVGGEAWCGACVSDAATTCERCDEVVAQECTTEVRLSRRNTATWCDTCASDHATRCDGCADYVTDTSTTTTADRAELCGTCYENDTAMCDECGDTYHDTDRVSHHEGSDSYRCSGCMPDDDDDDDDDGIASHGSTSNRGRFVCQGTGPLFFGIEWELECRSGVSPASLATTTRRILGSAVAGVESDSTITRGCETITHPLAVEVHRATWTPSVQREIQAVARGHDTTTCGMHLHATRSAIGGPIAEIKLAALLDDAGSLSTWSRIFRRDPSTYMRAQGVKYPGSKKSQWNVNRERFKVLNFQNDETVELRWPRGTTNCETIVATVEVYASMIRYVRDRSLDTAALTATAWIRWVWSDPGERAETVAARAYLRRRGLHPLDDHRHAHGLRRTTQSSNDSVAGEV